MIKQGIVQEAMADIGGPAQLPPLNNLPQWSRINTLDKARYPKPFLKDRLQPLPQPPQEGGSPETQDRRGSDGSSSTDPDLEITDTMNSSQKILHLERSIRFLQHQHSEVLANLHEEIDNLKRENKELQFRIVMVQKGMSPPDSPQKHRSDKSNYRATPNKSAPAVSSQNANAERSQSIRGKDGTSAGSSKASSSKVSSRGAGVVEEAALSNTIDAESEFVSQATEGNTDELKIIFLEEEIKELKKTLKEERLRNKYLTELLEQAQKLKVQPQSQALQEDGTGVMVQPTGSTYSLEHQPVEAPKLPYNATIVPLQVRLANHPARPPTLAECEVIMKHLQQTNDRQAHELNQLKSDLRDVLYSHKWTPDAYLLAKAYVAEDDAKEAAERERLPRIQLRQQTRKLPDIAYIQRDNVMLPALKQTMGNKAIERRKRTQILQKARVRREVLH